MPAILVLKDIPKFCVECPLIHLGDRFICKAANRWCGDEEGFFTSETKPTWCPLRPLPKKKTVEVEDISDVVKFSSYEIPQQIIVETKLETDKLITLGWNACLKEILGETE